MYTQFVSQMTAQFLTMLLWIVCVLPLFAGIEGLVPSENQNEIIRKPEGKLLQVTLSERTGCVSTLESKPPNRVSTTDRLQKLRRLMIARNISAYIITNSDDHQSTFVGVADRRREFITGFSGSAGDAVVTLNSAALWTDNRYYLQADEEMDCNWLLMKTGMKGVPSVAEWLVTQLQPGSLVSADTKKATYGEWIAWSLYLSPYQITMGIVPDNLIDSIWENRPAYPTDPVKIQEQSFAGENWQSKITRLRYILSRLGADMQIVTALDEIAWLLNLRGTDIPFTPVFRAYLTIGLNWATLYLPLEKITPLIRTHLYTATDHVLVMPYDWIWYDLPERAKKATKVLVPSQLNYSKGTSFLIHQMVPHSKILSVPSPIINMKAYKNSVEVEGMKNAHIRDAVAFCELWYRMENGLRSGENWDELKVVAMLEKLRVEQPFNRGPSFQSIVAFGTNGALPHYVPSFTTNKIIDNSSLLTVDSGGQYLDGTIDTTRMLHFGRPTARQTEIYTTLLKGCIDLVTTVFPAGSTMQELDLIIRRPLYQLGLDYGHGSTHGIGSYLTVHESFNYTYDINFFGSQEPGYYKENDFGMRLENIVQVIRANNTGISGKEYFTFEPITMVPYEKKLINFTMLDRKQVKWINTYYAKIRDLVGDEILKQGRHYLYKWLIEKTNPICLHEIE